MKVVGEISQIFVRVFNTRAQVDHLLREFFGIFDRGEKLPGDEVAADIGQNERLLLFGPSQPVNDTSAPSSIRRETTRTSFGCLLPTT